MRPYLFVYARNEVGDVPYPVDLDQIADSTNVLADTGFSRETIGA